MSRHKILVCAIQAIGGEDTEIALQLYRKGVNFGQNMVKRGENKFIAQMLGGDYFILIKCFNQSE